MNGRAKPYTRLPGRGGMIFLTSRLWQGRDHLLLVHSSGVTENYQRFYFRDIQAIVVQRTRMGKFLNWGFGAGLLLSAFALGCGLLLVSALKAGSGWEIGIGIACGLSGTTCLVALLFNLLHGPSCSVHVKTAVQVAELSSIRRLRIARKVLARVKPLIESAQSVAVPVAAAPPPVSVS